MNVYAMNRTIHFEDLLANALIYKISSGAGRSVTMQELEAYGCELQRWWRVHRMLQVDVQTSQYDVCRVMAEHGAFFERVFDANNTETFTLKPGKYCEDLRREFQAYLSVDMITAFVEAFLYAAVPA